jgi:hypothetical protein
MISELCFGIVYNWCAFVINPILGALVGVIAYWFIRYCRTERNGLVLLMALALLSENSQGSSAVNPKTSVQGLIIQSDAAGVSRTHTKDGRGLAQSIGPSDGLWQAAWIMRKKVYGIRV